jgi:hypothetical protein
MCTICDPRNVTVGHTGPPGLAVEVRLADVPDMKVPYNSGNAIYKSIVFQY